MPAPATSTDTQWLLVVAATVVPIPAIVAVIIVAAFSAAIITIITVVAIITIITVIPVVAVITVVPVVIAIIAPVATAKSPTRQTGDRLADVNRGVVYGLTEVIHRPGETEVINLQRLCRLECGGREQCRGGQHRRQSSLHHGSVPFCYWRPGAA